MENNTAPPRNATLGDEVIVRGFLRASNPHTERCRAAEIGEQHDQVDEIEAAAHRSTWLEIMTGLSESEIMLGGICEGAQRCARGKRVWTGHKNKRPRSCRMIAGD
jgi:hypothetical protein